MASIIDNRERTMLEALKNSLQQAERIDILTAFFYFSGFDALAEELKDKKIRILVGKSIDPNAIRELNIATKRSKNVDLSEYAKRGLSYMSNLQKRKIYTDSFIELINRSVFSSEFDSTESQDIIKMFLNKLEDGTLELRMTASWNHAKAYILTNKFEYSCNGDQKGVVFMGSNNFTYNGLLGQGEMAERFSDNTKYDEYTRKFEELWRDSQTIDIQTKESNVEFLNELKEKLWIFARPTPYSIFIRILFELYSSADSKNTINPYEISGGKFANLKYQIDAIKYGLDCINKNNGVIIADVVGLGKSIIASALAYNLDVPRTIIISPPHLVDQWEEYQESFALRGTRVYSSGKIEEIYKRYATDPDPILFIIDEAHRYRNELSETYQYLHQLTRSNAENKIILLTATPYNNRPQDLFALIKLFQTPSRSTINSVDNLGVRFKELIAKYNKLEKRGKKNLDQHIRKELEVLSQQLRILIDPVIVRRSRIDLREIREYAEDLSSQNIVFPEIVGPELIEYDLGNIRDLYLRTLERLSNDFISARYNPAAYLIDHAGFMKKYGKLFEQTDIQLFQGNLAKFVKRLLVMRFESSKAAFKETLVSILSSYYNMKKWWEKGYVPIKKQGQLPDPNDTDIEDTLRDIEDLDDVMDLEKIKKKAIPLPKGLFKEDFILAVESDIEILSTIKKEWFETDDIGIDPKFDKVKDLIDQLLEEKKDRKIVIFSYFADTVEYVHKLLCKAGYRTLKYTGASLKAERKIVRENFDASYRTNMQKNEYDIIVATDALSEGFNLNRAGVVINYDIPYNPTRVVQRIGRLNRINKKMFDALYVYNLFPTDIGEVTTLIKGISTLKMLLINNIIGSDTKTLTQDETLQSFFRKQYHEADIESGERSWDNEFKNIYDSVKHNTFLKNHVMGIPERSKIIRKGAEKDIAICFAKRGNNIVFATSSPGSEAKISSPKEVLHWFKALETEEGFGYDSELANKFLFLRDEIMRPHPKIKLDKRKGEALDKLQQLRILCPAERDYINDLLDIIKTYDDLSDGELKYISKLKLLKSRIDEVVYDLKQRISPHYIIQIKEKAEKIDAQTDIIMFTEDLRSDNR